MMFNKAFKAFNDSWEKLAQDEKNRDLDNAVRSWCRVISPPGIQPEQIVYYVKQWLNNQAVIKETNKLREEFSLDKKSMNWRASLEEHINYHFKELLGKIDKLLRENKNTKENEEDLRMKIKLVLFIAFVLTGVGLLLYYLNQKSSEEEKQQSREQPLRSTRTVTSSTPSQILVLVVGAKPENEALLQSLKENGKVKDKNEGQALRQATQYLWIGSQDEFSRSQLGNWFSSEQSVPEDKESEYDVYFVKIELSQPVSGFGRFWQDDKKKKDGKDDKDDKKNVSLVDRSDAFGRLPEFSTKVTVSPRLPSAAYGQEIFYRL